MDASTTTDSTLAPNTDGGSSPAPETVSGRGAAVQALRTAMAASTPDDAPNTEGGDDVAPEDFDPSGESGELDEESGGDDEGGQTPAAEPVEAETDETPGDDGMDAESLAGIAASLGFLDAPATPAAAAPKTDEPAPIPEDLANARKALAEDLSEDGIKAVDAIIARLAKAEAREAAAQKAQAEAAGSEYEKSVLGWFDGNAPADVFGSAKTRTESHCKMILAVHAGAIRIAEANAAQRAADPSIKAISGPQALRTSMQAYLLATGKGKTKAPASPVRAAPSTTKRTQRPPAPPRPAADPRSAGVAALKAALGHR